MTKTFDLKDLKFFKPPHVGGKYVSSAYKLDAGSDNDCKIIYIKTLRENKKSQDLCLVVHHIGKKATELRKQVVE